MTPREIIEYWLDVGEAKWYAVDPVLDAEITTRFAGAWREARDGNLFVWEETAEGALGLLILIDQFPRNMFRGKADAFSTDVSARNVTRRALARGVDLAFPARSRIFFYLPLMHSENLADQDLCVHLVETRLGRTSSNLPFALEHRQTIRDFGRFPMRNKALGRVSTAAEEAYIAAHQRH